MKKNILHLLLLCFITQGVCAQNLSIDNVYKAYLRNSGAIMEQNRVKGYYFFYMSDKIDKKTNEYTLQILDENLNKVKDIKFQDDKKVSLLESSYNGEFISFLFKNENDKTLDMKIYDVTGKERFVYSTEYTKKTNDLFEMYETMHSDEGDNQRVYDLGTAGFASVFPLRDGKERTFQVTVYSTDRKKQWVYDPEIEGSKYSTAEYLGSTDSLLFLQVMKKKNMLSGKFDIYIMALNYRTNKLAYEFNDPDEDHKFVPTNVVKQAGTGNALVMGNFFESGDNEVKSAPKGIAIIALNSAGKLVSKSYNSWENDFSKYLGVDRKGRVDGLGYVYIHKIVQDAGGKLFAIGEGYKKQISAGGIATQVLMAGLGGRSNVGVTKLVSTDMIVMGFDNKYRIAKAEIFEKHHNNIQSSTSTDLVSPHTLALMIKMMGGFDYEYTTMTQDQSEFNVGYSDYERSDDYKGNLFSALHYDGNKITKDAIPLKSKSRYMRVFPAKAGYIMMYEYFKKEKKIAVHLEKLG